MNDNIQRLLDSNDCDIVVRPFTRQTLADARVVVAATFDAGVLPLLEKILDNPVLDEFGENACGLVAYMEGRPVCFQASIIRKLYFGKAAFWGSVGSTTGLIAGGDPQALLTLVSKAVRPRGCALFWGNTACRAAARMDRMLGVTGKGVDTWMRTRYAVLRPVARMVRAAKTRMKRTAVVSDAEHVTRGGGFCDSTSGAAEVRRLSCIDEKTIDRFWFRYLENNEGLVCSRSGRELRWMFGERVARGTDVALGAFVKGELVGYVVARSCANRIWRIVDMIAIGNDVDCLRALMNGLVKFLKCHTKAINLIAKGFPVCVDGVIAECLRHVIPESDNAFVWSFLDKELGDVAVESWEKNQGWFFGPYDGDWSLCG